MLVFVVAAYAIDVAIGMRAVAKDSGAISGLRVREPALILRDWRGVPHIVAQNEHDAFFAQGFAEGSDRLFQMDLTRRLVEGRLSEIFGRAALATDERERMLPVDRLAQEQWQRLPSRARADLTAFAEGVNAAARVQPLPPEFRILLYRPQPWKPQDSLVTSFAIVLDLADLWTDVVRRALPPAAYERFHPLTDPCYDAPVVLGLAAISQRARCAASLASISREPVAGSNEWATGSQRNATARALLANDPHLRVGIPGIWYLVDVRFPGYRAAGATFAGLPGVILGHDDRVAWGATNGTVAALSVFAPPAGLSARAWTTETFHVRFGSDVQRRYYRAPGEFGVTVHGRFLLVRWSAYGDPASQLETFDGLDRARSIEEAERALRAYPGPTQNFVLADTSGRVAYQLAGRIPNDPLWARRVHSAADLTRRYSDVPFSQLPRVAASRNAVVWTANNKMYGAGYPYRLSPEFAPPYRAYRIAQMLEAHSRYGVAYFKRMQLDTLSLPELDLARAARCLPEASALLRWNGRFDGGSRAATLAYESRSFLTGDSDQRTIGVSTLLRATPCGRRFPLYAALARFLRRASAPMPWATAGAVTPEHALASIGITFLDGSTLPGDGDAFTLHVQSQGLSQSFRAVWDVGRWDVGGISIPQGESGEPGSPHYTDEAHDWVRGKLLILPYSATAVEASARRRLTLLP